MEKRYRSIKLHICFYGEHVMYEYILDNKSKEVWLKIMQRNMDIDECFDETYIMILDDTIIDDLNNFKYSIHNIPFKIINHISSPPEELSFNECTPNTNWNLASASIHAFSIMYNEDGSNKFIIGEDGRLATVVNREDK